MPAIDQHLHHQPLAAITWLASSPASGSPPHHPAFASSGTGGIAGKGYMVHRRGHSHDYWLISVPTHPGAQTPPSAKADAVTPSAQLMQKVQAGFGRTFSHLPAVFGVSRQTLYNWLKGEPPKAEHLPKLEQLAAAAQVFAAHGFKPTAQALNRSLSQSRSLIEQLAQGADGKTAAEKLIRLETLGSQARQRLDALLKGRTVRHDEPDPIRPTLDESA